MGLKKGFPGGAVVENPPANAGDIRDPGSIPGVGRFPWRREWQPTPLFLPRKFHGQGSWWARWSCKESDTTEWLSMVPTQTHTYTNTHTDTNTHTHTQTPTDTHTHKEEVTKWLFLVGNEKPLKETAEPKLVTSVLPEAPDGQGDDRAVWKPLFHIPVSAWGQRLLKAGWVEVAGRWFT